MNQSRTSFGEPSWYQHLYTLPNAPPATYWSLPLKMKGVTSSRWEKFALTKIGLKEETVLDHRTTDYRKDTPTLSEAFHRGREGVGCIT